MNIFLREILFEKSYDDDTKNTTQNHQALGTCFVSHTKLLSIAQTATSHHHNSFHQVPQLTLFHDEIVAKHNGNKLNQPNTETHYLKKDQIRKESKSEKLEKYQFSYHCVNMN